MKSVNPFSTSVPLRYPLKASKTGGFLMFSGGLEVEYWLKIGQKRLYFVSQYIELSKKEVSQIYMKYFILLNGKMKAISSCCS